MFQSSLYVILSCDLTLRRSLHELSCEIDFSDLIDQMKEEAARLGEENKELSGTIDEMEDSVAE